MSKGALGPARREAKEARAADKASASLPVPVVSAAPTPVSTAGTTCGNAAIHGFREATAEIRSRCDARGEANHARGFGRTAVSMRYLSGGAVRTLTTFERSSEFGQTPKTCGFIGYRLGMDCRQVRNRALRPRNRTATGSNRPERPLYTSNSNPETGRLDSSPQSAGLGVADSPNDTHNITQ